MHECDKCKEYGLSFKRKYKPVQFIEGKTNSIIWIVGLNPAAEQNWVDGRAQKDLENYLDDLRSIDSYFKDFKSVSESVFQNFGKDKGTAHTDIVKCSSKTFPPETAKGRKAIAVINNCKGFLEEQITTHKPKIIVCNGADVSKFMLDFLTPPPEFTKSDTSYKTNIGDNDVYVVLSGFIGRIDNYSRRRLGIEIERIERLIEANLTLTK